MNNSYRNLSEITDQKIYVGDPEVFEIPDNFAKAVLVYMVEETTKEESDYEIKDVRGSITYFKFVSDAGREAYNKNGMIFKTSDVNAVSCHECLIASNNEDRVVFFSADEDEDEDYLADVTLDESSSEEPDEDWEPETPDPVPVENKAK